MLGHRYEGQQCSAAWTLEIVGERWNLLILRNALFAGQRRFTEFQKHLGIATNILTKRLDGFVANGLMERQQTGSSGDQVEYVVTEKAKELKPVIMALTQWGDKWIRPGPFVFADPSDGAAVTVQVRRTDDGAQVPAAEVASQLR